MTTLTLTLDRLDEVQPGDRLVAIDEVALRHERTFTDGPRRLWPNGPIGIPFEHGGPTEAYLYPDSMIGRSITVERPESEPASEPAPEPVAEPAPAPQARPFFPTPPPVPAPPTVYLTERERKALRRNRHYVDTLRLLSDPDGGPVDLRQRIPRGEAGYGYFTPGHYSHQAGMLATWYGWTERVGDYTWRLTAKGRRVLAALDRA